MSVFENGILLPVGNYLDLFDTLYPFKNIYIYLFILVGASLASLLCTGFLRLWQARAIYAGLAAHWCGVQAPGVRSL